MTFVQRRATGVAVLWIALVGTVAAQTTNHVVISEFATRGPSSATDEFVELYNPTAAPVSIGSWKLQYKSASGTTWSERATLPPGAVIPARGFYLIAPSVYVGTVTPDHVSLSWTSGLADNGHIQIIDGTSAVVDKVGWGTAVDPEGGAPSPNHGTSANGNSVERKAKATSTADSLAAGGAHANLGNGEDTDNNGNDFVAQIHGRNPQNSTSPPEPPLAAGGNGTGRVSVQPAVVNAGAPVAILTFAVAQDSDYVIQTLAITVPPEWGWSRIPSDVSIAGTAFQAATVTVSGDTVLVQQANLSRSDSGTISLLLLTSPAVKGYSTFSVRTAIAAGALTPIVQQPRVRVLELVPIVYVHVNDSQGVPAAPYQVGAEVTVTGVVTGILSTTRTDVYIQDGTAGIDIFSFDLPPFAVNVGDSLTVTGTILQFRGLTEISPDFGLFIRHASGRPVPEPMMITCDGVNKTFQVDYTEPNESRLIRINGVTYNPVSSTITDVSGTTSIFIPNTFPPTPGVFDVVGILKQYKPGTPAPGPPYTADYEVCPRDSADIIAHPGPIITSLPFEDQIQSTSVRLQWTTNVPSSSIVRFGTSVPADSVMDPALVTNHAVVVPGLSPATVYYYSVGSGDANGTNFSPVFLFCTASPSQSTGAVNVYFNKSVNTGVAWSELAHGNENLGARLIQRINAARRSIDAALYNLSGTPGVGTEIANALVSARNRGVRVRVICEADNRNTSPFNFLVASGIPLVTDQLDAINAGKGLMHNKFLVIDGRGGAAESVWVWTGSWNPTESGTNDDYQNTLEIQDAALALAYTMEFDEMWGSSSDIPSAANSRFGARKQDNTPHRFVIGGCSVECYFSPSDRTTSHILDVLDSAQHSIAVAMLTLTRSDLANTLVAKKNAGCSFRGVFDNNSDAGSQYNFLLSSGLDVHLKSGSGLLHHKYAIVDGGLPAWDAVTVTGSHNWSSAAENANNENTLIIHDGRVANLYTQEFAARYYQFGGIDSIVTGVERLEQTRATDFALMQNYPNPFNPVTQIRFQIPVREMVILRVFDLLGREVGTLLNEHKPAGTYQVTFAGGGLASGVYFYRLEAGRYAQQKSMVLIK